MKLFKEFKAHSTTMISKINILTLFKIRGVHTSTNVQIGHQNILTFIFNPFSKLVYNFKAVPSASPILLDFKIFFFFLMKSI